MRSHRFSLAEIPRQDVLAVNHPNAASMEQIPQMTNVASNATRQPGWPISVYADEIYPLEVGIEPGLALLNRFGVKLTDLRVVNGRDSFLRLTDPELTALSLALKKYNIEVGALETPIFKCPLRKNNSINWGDSLGLDDDLRYGEHLELLSRAFAIADRLGAREVRCFSFWREYDFEEAFDEVVEKLAAAAERARAAGHRLYVENEQDTLAGTGVELARILKAVGSPHLTGAYNLGNSARLGGIPYPDDYGALKGLLGHVLVKFQAIDVRCGLAHGDADRSGPRCPDFAYYFWHQRSLPISGWVQIGENRFEIKGPRTFLPLEETVGVDYRSFFRALKQDGYDGSITADINCFIPGAGATSNPEVEANFEKALASLRKLIAEVWS